MADLDSGSWMEDRATVDDICGNQHYCPLCGEYYECQSPVCNGEEGEPIVCLECDPDADDDEE